MKKLVFLFVAFAAVSFASCVKKASNKNTDATDSVAVVEEAAVVEEVVAAHEKGQPVLVSTFVSQTTNKNRI